MKYQDENIKSIERWIEEGWEWGIPISHEEYVKALNGIWDVLLTPTVKVPHHWLSNIKGKKILGLASGGGQQMPIFTALGADCTVLDYSQKQLDSEMVVAKRENYKIKTIKADMSKSLPFQDEEFDLIFHPVSNCYIEEVKPLFKECYRILKHGGYFLGGYDNGINYLIDENDESKIINEMPFNPLKNEKMMEQLTKNDDGIQFSHSLEDNIGGQLEAGFTLLDIYEDTNGSGYLHELNIKTYYATRVIKK